MTPWNPCEQLSEHHPLESFSCGEGSIDDWCASGGRQAHASRLCRVWVSPGADHLAGFFTLSNHTVNGVDLPGKDSGAAGPVPATLLGKLAMHRDLRGQGFGNLLLLDAMQSAVAGSDFSSSRLLVLDAANQDVMRWYKKAGFKSFSDMTPLRMYMKMSTAAKLVERAG